MSNLINLKLTPINAYLKTKIRLGGGNLKNGAASNNGYSR